MTIAAGVLIIRDGKILAFQKNGKHGIALPCGKLQDDEPPIVGALREAYEEIGCPVLISHYDAGAYYKAEDDEGNIVYTFVARLQNEDCELSSTEEGTPLWATAEELMRGAYPKYNTAMLQHFELLHP